MTSSCDCSTTFSPGSSRREGNKPPWCNHPKKMYRIKLNIIHKMSRNGNLFDRFCWAPNQFLLTTMRPWMYTNGTMQGKRNLGSWWGAQDITNSPHNIDQWHALCVNNDPESALSAVLLYIFVTELWYQSNAKGPNNMGIFRAEMRDEKDV